MVITIISHCYATGSFDVWFNTKSELRCANTGLIRRGNQELRSFHELH